MLQRCLGNTHAINMISLQILFAYVLSRFVPFLPAEGTVGPAFTVLHFDEEAYCTLKNVLTD